MKTFLPFRRSIAVYARDLQRRAMLVAACAGGLRAMLVAGAALAICVWLDMLWELSPGLRAASWTGAFLAAGIAWLAGYLAAAKANSIGAIARRMDAAARAKGALVTGFDLECVRKFPSKLSAGLAAMAVERGATHARIVSPAQVAPARPIYRAAAAAGSAVVAVLFVAVVFPRWTQCEALRFFDPYGGHPPYSWIEFMVNPGDTVVRYGSPLDVQVALSAPVDELELVLDPGGSEQVLPMFAAADGNWTAQISDVLEPTRYRVRAGRQHSGDFSIGVNTVPSIESVRFRVEPPRYTQEAAYEGPLPAAGLAGLKGTAVLVKATSNRRLAAGQLTLEPSAAGTDKPTEIASLAPTPGEPRSVSGTFAINEAGRFRITVFDEAGQASLDSFAGEVVLLEDQRPLVRILEPQAMAIATPDAVVPVQVSAEDDYGVASVQLFRSLNDSRPRPIDLPISGATPRRAELTSELRLGPLGLSPGDVIKLFARVVDNDPAGGKGSESGITRLHIISQQDFERLFRARHNLEMLMSKYDEGKRRRSEAAERAEGLRKKLKEKPADKQADDQTREALNKLAEQLAEDARTLDEASKSLLPYDLDKNFARHLERLARRMQSSAKQLKRLASNRSLTNEQLAAELARSLKDLDEQDLEYEQAAIDPLEHLEKLFPLLADQERFVELYRQQRELAERLAAVKGHDGDDDPQAKMRMRDLEADQRRIHEELESLLADVEDHVARLPAGEDVDPELAARLDELRTSATDFLHAVRDGGAVEAMSDAEMALAEFAGTRSAERAKQAADLLEKLLSKCQRVQGKASLCLRFQPGLSSALGNTVEQLLADMGLGQSMNGQGAGQAGGSSARGNSMDNIGLYGRQPFFGGTERRGASGPRGASGGNAGSGSGPPGLAGKVGTGQLPGPEAASQGAIPARYRQRVNQYFQRLAEELGQ